VASGRLSIGPSIYHDPTGSGRELTTTTQAEMLKDPRMPMSGGSQARSFPTRDNDVQVECNNDKNVSTADAPPTTD
jgi:hypothetical protein